MDSSAARQRVDQVNCAFGNGNFTASQWSKFFTYSGMHFVVDRSGMPVHPNLPFTEISRVDGFAMILSSEEIVERVASTSACPSLDLPSAIDVNLTLSEPQWDIWTQTLIFDASIASLLSNEQHECRPET
ncbi:transferase [Aspergillus affinis]|uniref:transferase n=1 Tax=Aspergillus affinis TaxID=1070780 RepID=UPI0022FDD4E7|nr:transferase [Aspergillus affinis]KAI9037240.1 transferase [Aspergillus affinis]